METQTTYKYLGMATAKTDAECSLKHVSCFSRRRNLTQLRQMQTFWVNT